VPYVEQELIAIPEHTTSPRCICIDG